MCLTELFSKWSIYAVWQQLECSCTEWNCCKTRYIPDTLSDRLVLFKSGGVSMKYPCLILKSMCKTEIHLEIEQEGRNVYGEPLKPVIWDGLCNYQDSGKTVLTAEKVLIQLEGCALIPGDIAPELPVITEGDITVFGVTRHIYKGTKCRNPDGTVNYVRLDVM